ncbi:GspE/PulE family protein [Mucilaginibacter terrae]|uniref:Type IV pilus assembly protein PilB n=1 Tax=Mucilaginibacter terrae TaxID=1955052 RepID=A0ABU3GVE3_9SPHI|nr:GspE/PulE family protein [Mucilaginibacter terrae]MDT3403742.1 type IV pilus assembly protein PilB [Mucilaginibacter terrae]
MELIPEITLTTDQVHLLGKEQAWHYRILPKEKSDDLFQLYYDSELDPGELQDELEILTGLKVQLHPLPPAHIARLLSTYYLRAQTDLTITRVKGESDAINYLQMLIVEARNLNSSDIHIESYESKCRVRFRIDGMMIERYLLKQEDYPEFINIIKIQANLDIAEKRLPQDGRITFEHDEHQFDIRVSVLPTLFGEKAVLRLLNNDATDIDLNALGFSKFDLDNYIQGVKRPNGILLISGPTGSGKTTTLYATLKELNKNIRNILTIEDPVEYTLEGINQVQLKESIGLGFASALRTFLRQDPDVIMVGEIRDPETANMAIRAALTGHLVLSTIHTNSAWGTVSRLIDMGIPSFLVANTLNTTVAQRLLRLLCPHCKKAEEFDKSQYPKHFKPYEEVNRQYVAKGCEACYYTGYKGRKAVYEVIPIDHELGIEIKQGNTYIQNLLGERGIKTLAENAFNLFRDGMTTLDEIYPLLFNY